MSTTGIKKQTINQVQPIICQILLYQKYFCVLVVAQPENVQNYVKYLKYDIFVAFCFQTG